MKKRIQLDPKKLLGLKHLVASKGEKLQISKAMVGRSKIGASKGGPRPA